MTAVWGEDARPVTTAGGADVDGRRIAWTGFTVGAVLSVAANVAHAEPTPGARIAGAAWPLLLLLAFEVLTRVRWRPSRLRAFARYVGATSVAIVAAVMSYRHMAALLARYGEDGFGAHLGPLAVDGLMVVCGAALLSTAARPADTSADKVDEEVADEPAPGLVEDVPVESAAREAPVRPAAKPRKRTAKPRTSTGADISDLVEPIGRVLAEHGPGLGRDELCKALRAPAIGASIGGDERKRAALAEYRRQAAARPLEVAA